MIIYQSDKTHFIQDAHSGIENIISDLYFKKTGNHVGTSEKKSWKVSLTYMRDVLRDHEIPDDAGVAIEYNIPQSSKRIDFILTGQNEQNQDHAILVELKQWDEAKLTTKDAILDLGKFYGEKAHPSYQAWSYAALLEGFNETVYQEKIQLKPCAYLHNYIEDDVIKNDLYQDYINKAPVFLSGDDEKHKLREFIKKFVKHGDASKVLYRIENSRIRPSKNLSDSLTKMMKGNQEFVLIDDQKVVYETALALAKKSSADQKHVVIVEGGPGTGKSVIAINLLVATTKLGLNTQYVTKNAAPRAVYEIKLTGSFKKSAISSFFSGSGAFYDCQPNTFDVIVADEAHRLTEKSGLFKNKGVNQIAEIMKSANCSIFFIDEDQKVTLSDIGKTQLIQDFADSMNISVHRMKLTSQFRCNGSDGYVSWLDNILQIHETANLHLDAQEYDFQIVDNPTKLKEIITEKNKPGNKARLVAGYCWDWKSKKDPTAFDIVMPAFDFKMQWNLAMDGSSWLVAEDSVSEVGCIHTSQGLELDYVGVIVGNDLVVRDGKVVTDPSKRSTNDQSIKGYKKLLAEHPQAGQELLDSIIKNTYRTLMTRGMKGCYVYFVDKETEEWFRGRINTVE